MRDGTPVDLLPHLNDALKEGRDVEVLVGSDSQNKAGHTIYSTAVVLRFKGNGAHVLYRKEKAIRIRDLWTRLWGEVERSVEVAKWLRQEGVSVTRIDMDINSDPLHGSHRLHATAVGYVRAHGIEAMTKPGPLIATWAANVLCNGGPQSTQPPST